MADAALLEERLGYAFQNPELLNRALTHRSWVAEHSGTMSNERLEFLGDAVLGWVIADMAFHRFGDSGEGTLTDLRKSVVNANALASVATEIGVGEFMLLGRGEDAAGGRSKASIVSDAMEALIGAIYLDGGAPAAFALIERFFADRLLGAVDNLDRFDGKTALQELAATLLIEPPVYRTKSTGPDHERMFTATVVVGGQQHIGTGRSKKHAEQQAALAACAALAPGGSKSTGTLSDVHESRAL